MNKNCVICGVGGQGTVLASRLIASCAMSKGYSVKTAETIGMAQQGGCVVSHVKYGEEIFSPLVEHHTADILMAFEPAEAVRCLPYLKENGTVIVSNKVVLPTTATLSGKAYTAEAMIEVLKAKCSHVVVIDTVEKCKSLGSNKVLNVVMLGALAKSGKLGFTVDDFKETIIKIVPQRYHELNLKAIDA
jgi:indolepyruvate ferredoxin oxidoreductase beta subunit